MSCRGSGRACDETRGSLVSVIPPPLPQSDNLDLFWDKGFAINGQVAGNEDGCGATERS